MERQFTELNFQIVIEPKIIESTFNLLNSSLAHVSTLKTFLNVFLEKNRGGTLNLKLFQVIWSKLMSFLCMYKKTLWRKPLHDYSFSEKSPNKDLTVKALTYSDSL